MTDQTQTLHVDLSLLNTQIAELEEMLDEHDAPGDHPLQGLANMLYDVEDGLNEHDLLVVVGTNKADIDQAHEQIDIDKKSNTSPGIM